MKKFAIAILATVITTANVFAASTTEVLQQKLDAAIASSDWRTAETISTVMANVSNAANQREQAEFFRQQNDVTRVVTNFYKAAPAMLKVAQSIMSPDEGTEDHFALKVVAPHILKIAQTGELDAANVIQEWKKFEAAQEARRFENKKRWEEQRKKWEEQRKQREAARGKRVQR